MLNKNLKKQHRKLNNTGSGLISVLIAMTFIAILGSLVMTTSYLNYKMKQTNMRTKDSFYTAEQAMDEISIGLQNVVSEAISEAYIEVLENYSSYDITKKNDLMESLYFTYIWDALGKNAHTQYDLTTLQGYLKKTKWVGTMDAGYGALVSTGTNTPTMVTYEEEGVVLKNLQVYYKDAFGYVSIIQTDIKLALPKLRFASNTVLPDITNFSLVADEGLSTGTLGTNEVKGNLYASTVKVTGNGATPLRLSLMGGSQIVVKGDVTLENAELFVDKKSQLWATDLQVASGSTLVPAKITLQGESNIADDLNLTGRGSQAVIQGTYNGYGNLAENADKSSAILINGTDTILDLEKAEMVTLAGHAYVGTQGVKGSDGSSLVEHTGNVMTGESVSVKSNQLMYLIPAECLGVRNGKSKFGKNPLTAAEYQEIMKHPDEYQELKADLIVDKLGHPLSDYLKYQGSIPQAEKVFAQGSRGTMVYYYMTFADEAASNRFFRDYYGIQVPKIDAYMDFYTNGITMKDPQDMVRVQLAGNMLRYNQTQKQSVLQSNTVEDAENKLISQYMTYDKTFQALCTKLVTNYAELTNLKETDLTKNIVFDNLVDSATLKKFIDQHGDTARQFKFIDTERSISGILVDNAGREAYVYKGDPNLHLIIATGDVVVNKNYKGLILTDQKITLADNVLVESAEADVKAALKLHTEVDGKVYNLMGFLWDGAEFLNISDKDDVTATESVQLEDLIVYENWSKE
ncbi:MAG: hypothetical protein RRX92_08755 [Lachnospiraceae bacterium]